MRILVVEDSAAQRHVLLHLLRTLGHHAVAVASAEAALAHNMAFDAVIADLRLPGMAGDVLLATLRARMGPQALLMCMTAGDPLPHGAFLSLAKPITAARLVQALAGIAVDAGPDSTCHLVDHGRLATLRSDLGRAAAQRLLQRFVAEADAVCAAPANDAMTLHHLAGAAALFGAPALQAALTRDAGAWRALWPATRAALLQSD
jgi:CheY-like chemotaxis protein